MSGRACRTRESPTRSQRVKAPCWPISRLRESGLQTRMSPTCSRATCGTGRENPPPPDPLELAELAAGNEATVDHNCLCRRFRPRGRCRGVLTRSRAHGVDGSDADLRRYAAGGSAGGEASVGLEGTRRSASATSSLVRRCICGEGPRHETRMTPLRTYPGSSGRCRVSVSPRSLCLPS